MEIITGTADFYINDETAVAIGKFDGVHIGHRALLDEILKQKENGKKACVFTFDPSPAVFFGDGKEKQLTTREEKREIFERLGIDILVEYPLNRKVADMAPRDFVVNVLCNRINAVYVAAGSDLSFGRRGEGNAALLRILAPECGMTVKIIDKLLYEGREISSTYVRETLEKGDMRLTEILLGEAYFICGKVTHGRQLGRTLGMPTLNLIPDESKMLPPRGVYYSGVMIRNRYYSSITNIGYKPTIEQDKPVMCAETYVYDFDEDIYGEDISVYLYEFRRPEQKFAGIEALKEQMQKDIAAGREYAKEK